MLPIVVGVSVAPSGFLFRDANSVAWVVLVRYLASQRASSFLGILNGMATVFPSQLTRCLPSVGKAEHTLERNTR